ncbi:MAG: thiamine-phosphate kinase [Planctomycetes bacterium]|nr:thiamine-phosphate kinase [Planctomycetota bacterium]MBU2596697.1 thiamine-phosphate kinase [Planctomycetota bacterium]
MNRGETELVKYFAAKGKLNAAKFPIGIGDDMAQIKLSKKSSVLITTDMLLDGVHFDGKKASPEQIGYKSMATSLSDCAAMATVPLAAVVSVALPRNYGSAKLKRLHKGLLNAAKKYNCPLIGGDMTSWGRPLAVSVAMLSVPAKTKPVKRSTAKTGDVICITGTLGGSIVKRHLEFEPRLKESLAIARAGANAMIDISDGLSTDLNHICRLSKKGAVIEADKIPVSRNAKGLESALNDGEDFELLFMMPKKKFERLKKQWRFKVKLTAIGRVTKGGTVKIKKSGGKAVELLPKGYDHLKENSKF